MTRLTAPALRRGLDILELLNEEGQGLRVPEITQRLELPRATAHELVNALADRGYVVIAKDSGRVTLGVSVLRLGAGYERALDLVSIGRECANEVATKCGETVQLVVRDGANAVFIVRIDSKHSVRLVSQVGSSLPASCTAGGKMLLSLLEPAALDELLPDDQSLLRMTSHSISTRAHLDKELALHRQRGWSVEYCESNDHATCVAAPVYNRLGEAVAAMSISVPVIRWNEEDLPDYVAWVQEGARRMSGRMGGPAAS